MNWNEIHANLTQEDIVYMELIIGSVNTQELLPDQKMNTY